MAIALTVTGGCLYFAFRDAHWEEIRAVLGRTHYGWVTLMAAISVFSVYLRALRWRVLLAPAGRVAVAPLFAATSVGFMANMLLPLRAGEVIRPVMAARRTGVPMSTAFASIVLERLFDMLLLFAMLIVLSVSVPVSATMRRASYVMSVVIIALFALLVVLLRNREHAVVKLRGWAGMLPGNMGPRVGEVLASFVTGLSGINDRRTVSVLVGYSLAVWLSIGATFGCGILALDIDAPLVAASASLMLIVAAFVALPQAPGYVGTWQAGCVAALAFYGVSLDVAIGLSLITHIVQLLVVIMLGGLSLATDSMRFSDMVALAQHEERVDQP
jgi:uncharacterized protein (TIRG00374 family)